MDATTNNPEFAGCPLCGRKPAERHATYWTGMRSVISMYRYECNVDSDHKISVSGKTDEEAIAAWNRRIAAEAPAPSEPAPSEPAAQTVDNLAALVARLSRQLMKAAPAHDLPALALDYLKREGLQGSPLRGAAPLSQPSIPEHKGVGGQQS